MVQNMVFLLLVGIPYQYKHIVEVRILITTGFTYQNVQTFSWHICRWHSYHFNVYRLMGFTLTVSSLLDSSITSRMNHSWMNEPRYCVELVSIPSSPHQNLQMLPWIEIVTSSEEHLGDILDSCPLQYLVRLMNITLWNNLNKIKQILFFLI